MSRPSARELLTVWEWGGDRHSIDRSLALLAIAQREDRDALADWTVGRRDAALLRLRESLFGPTLELQAQCPSCEEGYEFDYPVKQLIVHDDNQPADPYELELGGRVVRLRLPTSRDLAQIAPGAAPTAARRAVVELCLVSPAEPRLTDPEVEQVAAALLDLDPQAEIRFPFSCGVCETSWFADLDIASYLWAELEGWAARTMRDVATLSRHFGWSEAAILAMSDRRRAHYIELAGS